MPPRTELEVPSGRPAEEESLGAYGGRATGPALLVIVPKGCDEPGFDLAKRGALFDVWDSFISK
jgi:hypothetical protein